MNQGVAHNSCSIVSKSGNLPFQATQASTKEGMHSASASGTAKVCTAGDGKGEAVAPRILRNLGLGLGGHEGRQT